MTIHSFRRVLKVRRHIHAIPWSPGKSVVLWTPVPLLGFVYFVGLLAVFFVLSLLPGVGALADVWGLGRPLFIWWLLPVWGAVWLVKYGEKIDGREPHLLVRSFVLFWLRPKRTRAGLAVRDGGRLRGRVRYWVDEHAPTLHRSRVRGPADVRFNVPTRFQLGWFLRRHWEARPDDRSSDVRVQHVVERLEVKP